MSVTATDIKTRLRQAYCQPEWAIFFEVSDGVGANQRRRADAIAMNMWPSRGLELRAFEIKVRRDDLLRELKDPSKAEAIAQYCNTFYLVTPKDLIKPGELPAGWGHVTLSENGQLYTHVQSTHRDNVDLSRVFMASLLRSNAKVSESEWKTLLHEERIKIEEDAKKRFEQRLVRELRMKDRNREFVDKIHKAIRDDRGWLNDERVLECISMVYRLGLDSTYDCVGGIHKHLQQVKNAAEELLPDLTRAIERFQSED